MIAGIASAGRHQLGHWPTPLEELSNLSAYLNGPRIYIKRDDCTGLATGGNKTRKLEFLVADALGKGADTLITIGAVQSNHSRQTAAAAAVAGLRCEIIALDCVANPAESYLRSGNRLLMDLLGATVHSAPGDADPEEQLRQVAQSVVESGGRPYIVPFGGSCQIGAMGYAVAASELLDQIAQRSLSIDLIVHASGSGGTQAGLLAGLRASDSSIPVLGVSIVEDHLSLGDKVTDLVQIVAKQIGASAATPSSDVQLTGDYVGDGYGLTTPACLEAIEMVATSDGILLDPVYTGKAMAALVDLIRAKEYRRGQSVVFLHTGGSPGLFAYVDDFVSAKYRKKSIASSTE